MLDALVRSVSPADMSLSVLSDVLTSCRPALLADSVWVPLPPAYGKSQQRQFVCDV